MVRAIKIKNNTRGGFVIFFTENKRKRVFWWQIQVPDAGPGDYWLSSLSYTVYLETALLNIFGQKSVIENMAYCDVKRVTVPYSFSDDR